MADKKLTEAVLQLDDSKIFKALDEGADVNLFVESGNKVNNSRTITRITPSYPMPALWHMLMDPDDLFERYLERNPDIHIRNPHPKRVGTPWANFVTRGMNILLYVSTLDYMTGQDLIRVFELLQERGMTLDESVDDEGRNIFDFLAVREDNDNLFFTLNQPNYLNSLLGLFPNILSFLDERHMEILNTPIGTQKKRFFQNLINERERRKIRQVGRNVLAAEVLQSPRVSGKPGLPPNSIREIQKYLSGVSYINSNVPPTLENTMDALRAEHNAIEGGKRKRKTKSKRIRKTKRTRKTK